MKEGLRSQTCRHGNWFQGLIQQKRVGWGPETPVTIATRSGFLVFLTRKSQPPPFSNFHLNEEKIGIFPTLALEIILLENQRRDQQQQQQCEKEMPSVAGSPNNRKATAGTISDTDNAMETSLRSGHIPSDLPDLLKSFTKAAIRTLLGRLLFVPVLISRFFFYRVFESCRTSVAVSELTRDLPCWKAPPTKNTGFTLKLSVTCCVISAMPWYDVKRQLDDAPKQRRGSSVREKPRIPLHLIKTNSDGQNILIVAGDEAKHDTPSNFRHKPEFDCKNRGSGKTLERQRAALAAGRRNAVVVVASSSSSTPSLTRGDTGDADDTEPAAEVGFGPEPGNLGNPAMAGGDEEVVLCTQHDGAGSSVSVSTSSRNTSPLRSVRVRLLRDLTHRIHGLHHHHHQEPPHSSPPPPPPHQKRLLWSSPSPVASLSRKSSIPECLLAAAATNSSAAAACVGALVVSTAVDATSAVMATSSSSPEPPDPARGGSSDSLEDASFASASSTLSGDICVTTGERMSSPSDALWADAGEDQMAAEAPAPAQSPAASAAGTHQLRVVDDESLSRLLSIINKASSCPGAEAGGTPLHHHATQSFSAASRPKINTRGGILRLETQKTYSSVAGLDDQLHESHYEYSLLKTGKISSKSRPNRKKNNLNKGGILRLETQKTYSSVAGLDDQLHESHYEYSLLKTGEISSKSRPNRKKNNLNKYVGIYRQRSLPFRSASFSHVDREPATPGGTMSQSMSTSSSPSPASAGQKLLRLFHLKPGSYAHSKDAAAGVKHQHQHQQQEHQAATASNKIPAPIGEEPVQMAGNFQQQVRTSTLSLDSAVGPFKSRAKVGSWWGGGEKRKEGRKEVVLQQPSVWRLTDWQQCAGFPLYAPSVVFHIPCQGSEETPGQLGLVHFSARIKGGFDSEGGFNCYRGVFGFAWSFSRGQTNSVLLLIEASSLSAKL
ncbi:unnamed protein product [Notodromas monacha]|uniref:Uncharacterized protein n=1 Tax=Notodromas monacha TaxID=399045 RepID=A0A7R9BMI5_9CRUS|nr:unnamed protein product [Notodromas monacha]CAG0917422.1 unnamed protein product [Notodromas monacha]